MPYIKQEDRNRVDETAIAKSRGELNYLISKTLNQYIKDNGLTYTHCDEVVEVLNAIIECFRNPKHIDNNLVVTVTDPKQKILTAKLMYIIGNVDKQAINTHYALFGVLDCVKMEFYRRVVAVLEDEKIQINGDIYELA